MTSLVRRKPGIARFLRFKAFVLILVLGLYVVGAFQPSHMFQKSATSSSTFLAAQPQNYSHHRVDFIDTHPNSTMSMSPNNNDASPTKLRRYYDTFIWKKNALTSQDYKINYRVEGPRDGPPVLLVHGFGASVNHFRFQFPALTKEGYRVYAIDLLGFGGSDKPSNASYSIELFVQLLEDFVMEMEPGKDWIAAGNSLGGLCSLGLAAELPDKIKGVILFNTSSGMSFRYNQIPLLLRPILWCIQKFVLANPKWGGTFFENFKKRENIQSILTTLGVYGNTSNVDDELLDILLGPADDEGARDVFRKVFGGDPGPTPESFLARIECPVLALWGEADPWTVIAAGESFAKHAKQDNCRLEALPGAGHCPHDESPERVHEIMLPWMKEILHPESKFSTEAEVEQEPQ